MIKISYLMRRQPQLSRDDFQAYWGRNILRLRQLMPFKHLALNATCRSYLSNHPVETLWLALARDWLNPSTESQNFGSRAKRHSSETGPRRKPKIT